MISFIIMNLVASVDQEAILKNIELLVASRFPVFGILPSRSPYQQNIRVTNNSQDKLGLAVPFADYPGSGFEKFGAAEIAGTRVVSDSSAHRDSRPKNVLNVHHMASGNVIGKFALLPDELHDESLDLLPTFDELINDYEIEAIQAETGLTLCFLGGVATHGFESTDSNRLSVIQSFSIV